MLHKPPISPYNVGLVFVDSAVLKRSQRPLRDTVSVIDESCNQFRTGMMFAVAYLVLGTKSDKVIEQPIVVRSSGSSPDSARMILVVNFVRSPRRIVQMQSGRKHLSRFESHLDYTLIVQILSGNHGTVVSNKDIHTVSFLRGVLKYTRL